MKVTRISGVTIQDISFKNIVTFNLAHDLRVVPLMVKPCTGAALGIFMIGTAQ